MQIYLRNVRYGELVMKHRCFGAVAALLFLGSTIALAGDPPPCISACETAAQTCATGSHKEKDTCLSAARAGCKGVPYATLAACMRTSQSVCSDKHNPEIEACDSNFRSCHKACVPQNSTSGYWCKIEVETEQAPQRISGYCNMEQSEKSLAACLKVFEAKGPAGRVSLVECMPL